MGRRSTRMVVVALAVVLGGTTAHTTAAHSVAGFPDVTCDVYYAHAVDWAEWSGYTDGVGVTGLFMPHLELDRAQAATFLHRYFRGWGDQSFPDVQPGTYYYDAVRWMVTRGITTGVGDTGLFQPHAPVTRAQLITFFWRIHGGYLIDEDHGFVDVPRGVYYEDALRWAAYVKLVRGVGGSNRFEPDQVVDRAQMITMLFRYSKSGIPNPECGYPIRR